MKIPDRIYDVLKWLCIVCIPALNTFLGCLLPQVGVAAETVTTVITIIAGLGAFIGTLIGVSTVAYKQENESK